MVAKINRGASLYGAVIYNQQTVNEATGLIIAGNRMITDFLYDSERIVSQTIFAFESYLAANRNTEKRILHISLNPTLDDNLTDSQFADLARAYMQKMGYGNQPYIVYLHEDIDRRHIHIVSICVNENGEKIDDAYEWNRSMKACRELEQMFGLKQIADKRKELLEPYLKKADYTRGDVKQQVSNILKSVFTSYRFQSFGEYSAMLSCFNIEAKQVKGEYDGKPYSGIIYTMTDDNGKPICTPIKSSLIGKRFGKILQQRQSVSINRQDTSTSINTQLDFLIPASKISNLSQGTFVGSVADNFGEEIDQKIFHSRIIVDSAKVSAETKAYKKIPIVNEFKDENGNDIMQEQIERNYSRIKDEVEQIVQDEMERIKTDPELRKRLLPDEKDEEDND